MTMTNEQVVDLIREERLKKGVSMTFMARKMGYSNASGYANIEYGKKKISLENTLCAFKILNIPSEKLFFEEKLFIKNN